MTVTRAMGGEQEADVGSHKHELLSASLSSSSHIQVSLQWDKSQSEKEGQGTIKGILLLEFQPFRSQMLTFWELLLGVSDSANHWFIHICTSQAHKLNWHCEKSVMSHVYDLSSISRGGGDDVGVTGENAVKTADRGTTLVGVKPLDFVVTKTRLYLKRGQDITCHVCGDLSSYCMAKNTILS